MKKLLPLLFISICSVACTKKTQLTGKTINKTISVNSFTAIANSSSATIELDASIQPNKVLITGNENLINNIDITNSNGQLHIKNKESVSFKSNKTPVLIKMNNPDLEKVVIAGSGSVATNDITLKKNVEFHISGAGEINVKLFNNNTGVFVTGTGSVRLRGVSNEIKASITGAGNLNAEELTNKLSDIEISGAGNVKVNTTDQINVKISGVGNLDYKNYDQLKIVKKISGIGTVNAY